MVNRGHFWKIAFRKLTHWETGVYRRINVHVSSCLRNWANQLAPLTPNSKHKSNNYERHNESTYKSYVWHEHSAHISIMSCKLNIACQRHFPIWHKKVQNYNKNSFIIPKPNAVSPKMANSCWMPWTFSYRPLAHCAIKPSRIRWSRYDNMKWRGKWKVKLQRCNVNIELKSIFD